MYSLLQRLNVVTATATTGLLILLPLVALSGWWQQPRPTPAVQIAVHQTQVFHGSYDPYYSDGGVERDHAFSEIDLDADLTSLFNWNTKQLYVNLVAEYESATHTKNQVTLWDTLVLSIEEAQLKLRRQQHKYSFTDIRRSFDKQQEVKLVLQWNVVSWIGPMFNGRQSNEGTAFVLPPVSKAAA